MDKKTNLSDLKNIGLFKIFSNLDTQSAIVAAISISVLTFLVSGFSNLCNYIYWSAYFNKFNIPLSYIEEAIIPANNTKYILLMYIPAVIFIWLFLRAILHLCQKLTKKISELRAVNTLSKQIKSLLKWSSASVLIIIISGLFPFIFEIGKTDMLYIALSLYAETVIFVLWHISKATIGKRFSFSQKKYYSARIIFIFVSVYLVLGTVYFSGSLENYNSAGNQSLQIVYDSDTDYSKIDSDDKISSQLILFETKDYYYITDILVINPEEGALSVMMLGNDTYRFIDKVDCPVKTIYANLIGVGSSRNELTPAISSELFIITVTIFTVSFICLLSIPKKDEEDTKPSEINGTNTITE